MGFNEFASLSRAEIWQRYHSGKKPKGGSWEAGYVFEGSELFVALNVGAARFKLFRGKNGHH